MPKTDKFLYFMIGLLTFLVLGGMYWDVVTDSRLDKIEVALSK